MKPTLVIIGLGNPGSSYDRTRHNMGFQGIDALSSAFGEGQWEDRQKFLSQTQEARIVTVPVLLVKPQTFMNRSGEAVRKIVDFFKLDSKSQLLVLSDDVDLPLGDTRIRMKGGPGTHNGMKSIVETLGEEFPRLRIGIGTNPPGSDLATWVLSTWSTSEWKMLEETLKGIPGTVKNFVMSDA